MTNGTFLSKGAIRHVAGRVHEVTEAVQYRASNGTLYVVPIGAQTDGGSVPRLVWWLYPPFGDEASPAYVLHDYLYQRAEYFTGTDLGHRLSRAEADGLLLDALEALTYRASARRTIHAAVRAGGWAAWKAHRNTAKAEREAGV